MNPVPKSCRSELFDDRCRSHTACSIDFSYRTGYRYVYRHFDRAHMHWDVDLRSRRMWAASYRLTRLVMYESSELLVICSWFSCLCGWRRRRGGGARDWHRESRVSTVGCRSQTATAAGEEGVPRDEAAGGHWLSGGLGRTRPACVSCRYARHASGSHARSCG